MKLICARGVMRFFRSNSGDFKPRFYRLRVIEIRVPPLREWARRHPAARARKFLVAAADLAVADLDSYGRCDLVVVGRGEIAWHRALPGGGFAAASAYASSASTSVAIVRAEGTRHSLPPSERRNGASRRGARATWTAMLCAADLAVTMQRAWARP
jgi:hypothetical protein